VTLVEKFAPIRADARGRGSLVKTVRGVEDAFNQERIIGFGNRATGFS